jgi:hypothetical protein
MKFCKDCTHFLPLSEMCNSEQSVKGVDMIWGRHEKLPAREMRDDSEKCGLSAKLFVSIGEFKKFHEGVIL